MNEPDLRDFLHSQRWAVQAAVSPDGAPQAALVGIAVTDALELVFDTSPHARKLACLRHDPRVAFVIGGWTEGDERTVQYEGVADLPQGDELERLLDVYFRAFPDGRARRGSGVAYVRVRPRWIRFSDFNRGPDVHEFRFGSTGG
jgi:pyridoxine/pyridoxamine 5'-phosphate oxidase